MAVQITGSYLGELRTEVTHGPSGSTLRTAAPVDNQGDGSSFSPTDLAAAALGSCILTTMAIAARREGIPFERARFSLEKHMQSGPRRIGRIPVTVHLSAALGPGERRTLEHAALNCPVHLSLLPEIEKEVRFVYE